MTLLMRREPMLRDLWEVQRRRSLRMAPRRARVAEIVETNTKRPTPGAPLYSSARAAASATAWWPSAT